MIKKGIPFTRILLNVNGFKLRIKTYKLSIVKVYSKEVYMNPCSLCNLYIGRIGFKMSSPIPEDCHSFCEFCGLYGMKIESMEQKDEINVPDLSNEEKEIFRKE